MGSGESALANKYQFNYLATTARIVDVTNTRFEGLLAVRAVL